MPKKSVNGFCMIHASVVLSMMVSRTDSLRSGTLEQSNQYLRYWSTLSADLWTTYEEPPTFSVEAEQNI